MAETYLPRLLAAPAQSFFLFGPRGSGKSTWVRHELPTAPRIDLLDETLYQSYLARPAQFSDELRAEAPGTTVVVDEIQRLPRLLNEVHRFIEERRLRFVLCGSSARKLKQQGRTCWPGVRFVDSSIRSFRPSLGRRSSCTPCSPSGACR